MMAANLCRFCLPGWRKFFHENHIMRISHRYRCSMHFPKGTFDGKIIAHLRLAHIHLKFEMVAIAGDQLATLDSSASANGELALSALLNQVRSHAAGAIAGDF